MKLVQFLNHSSRGHEPWNKDKIIGQKPPFKLREVWSIRTYLQLGKQHRDLALFNLAIDSKLRACDLVGILVSDVALGNRVHSRAVIRQRKTGQTVQFEISEQTREARTAWKAISDRQNTDYLFPSRMDKTQHLSTR